MDIRPVLSYKGADSAGMFFCVMQLWYNSFVLHSALIPLCIHGNRCPNGSATGKINNVKSYVLVDYNHWKVQTSTSVLLATKESQDSSMMESFVICCEDPPMSHHI